MFRKPNLPLLGLAVSIVVAAFASGALGEIAKRDGAGAAKTAPVAAAPRLAADTPLRVECWQDGQKIISEDGLFGFTVSSLRKRASVTFRRVARGDADVFILSLKHSTCLIKHSDREEGE